MRDVRQQCAEGDHELDTEVACEADDQVGERPPAVVRLDTEQDHRVAVRTWNRGVEERVLRPFEVPGEPVVERDVGSRGLEVDETLGVEIGEPLCVPQSSQVAGSE